MAHLGNLETTSVGKHNFAKLVVYAGEPEEYHTFVTPECYETLLEFKKKREDAGERVSATSPLIAQAGRWGSMSEEEEENRSSLSKKNERQ